MSGQMTSLHPADEEANKEEALYINSKPIPPPPIVPPAPPLPPSLGGLSVLKPWKSQDLDSGCGSFGDKSYFDELPGCNISDDEFNENFAVSRSSSRRSSSQGLTIVIGGAIPVPPPPPPVQFFIPRFTLADGRPNPDLQIAPRRNVFRRNDSDVSSLTSDSEPDIEFPTNQDILDEDSVCIVCYDTGRAITRTCCKEKVCQRCIGTMIQTRLNEGLIQFSCPNPECSVPIGRMEVLDQLDEDSRARFERLRVNAESDGNKKTCPHCSHITEHNLPVRMRKLREEEVKIQCVNCSIEWCFKCHAPWHQGLTCKEFTRGNKQFQKWTKDRPNGVANCQKCPTCRVFIQRSTGCDHMTCNRCSTHFCYKCGGRFIEVPGLGDHYQRMSMFGCKYNYLSDRPIKRKALRGGYFGAKIATLTGYPILFVGGVAVVVVVGAVALPIYGSYRLYKFRKNMNRLRRRRRPIEVN